MVTWKIIAFIIGWITVTFILWVVYMSYRINACKAGGIHNWKYTRINNDSIDYECTKCKCKGRPLHHYKEKSIDTN